MIKMERINPFEKKDMDEHLEESRLSGTNF